MPLCSRPRQVSCRQRVFPSLPLVSPALPGPASPGAVSAEPRAGIALCCLLAAAAAPRPGRVLSAGTELETEPGTEPGTEPNRAENRAWPQAPPRPLHTASLSPGGECRLAGSHKGLRDLLWLEGHFPALWAATGLFFNLLLFILKEIIDILKEIIETGGKAIPTSISSCHYNA